MKTLFVEERYEKKYKLPKKIIEKLPQSVCIATTIQYLDSIEGIKKQIEKTKRKVTLFKGKKTKYPGQILGCEIKTAQTTAKAYLYIGDGMFHPKTLKLKSKKDVYTYNPLNKKLGIIDDKEIEIMRKKEKGALLKYYTAKNIGIIVTTKPGQNQTKKAEELKKKLKDKKVYIFLCDTLDFNQLENFNFIEVWINTMCPRIAYDDREKFNKPIININEILE